MVLPYILAFLLLLVPLTVRPTGYVSSLAPSSRTCLIAATGALMLTTPYIYHLASRARLKSAVASRARIPLDAPNAPEGNRDVPIALHAHGYGDWSDNYAQTQVGYRYPGMIHSFVEFGECREGANPWDRPQSIKPCNLAQEEDITHFRDAIINTRTTFGKNNPLILYGLSRGGSVVASIDGYYNIPNHKGSIIQSAFADTEDTIKHAIGKVHPRLALFSGVASTIFSLLPSSLTDFNFKSSGPQPIFVVQKGTVPQLYIASLHDNLVPAWSTVKLYLKALNAGRDVYLVILPAGDHAKIAGRFMKEEEAFIAYCLGKATEAQIAFLKTLQPTADELAQRGLVR